jgi:hypothetical protein
VRKIYVFSIFLSIALFSVANAGIIGEVLRRAKSVVEYPAANHLMSGYGKSHIVVSNNSPFIGELYSYNKLVAVLFPGEEFNGEIPHYKPSQSIPLIFVGYKSYEDYKENRLVGIAGNKFSIPERSQHTISWIIDENQISGLDGRRIQRGAYPPVPPPRNRQTETEKKGDVSVLGLSDDLFNMEGFVFLVVINTTNYKARVTLNGGNSLTLEPGKFRLTTVKHLSPQSQGHLITATLLNPESQPILARNSVQQFSFSSQKSGARSEIFWIKPPQN